MPIDSTRPRAPRAVRAVLLAALGAAAAGGCMTADPTSTRQPSSNLRVVQLIPDAPTLEVLVDDVSVYPAIGFRFVSGFFNVAAGNRRVRLRTGGGTDVIDLVHAVEFPRAYTVFATGRVGDIQGFVLPDTAPVPAGDRIALRFVQGAPAAGTVDVYVTDQSTDLATATPVLEDVPFRGAREYLTLAPGRHRIRVTTAGTTTVLFDLTQTFADRSMRTLVTTDAAGGGAPIAGLLLIDF